MKLEFAFNVGESRVYRVTGLPEEFLGRKRWPEVFIGLRDNFSHVVLHASIIKTSDLWSVTEYGVTGWAIEQPDGGKGLFFEFLDALESHLDNGPLVFLPWLEDGKHWLEKYRPELYAIYESVNWNDSACIRELKRIHKIHHSDHTREAKRSKRKRKRKIEHLAN